MYEQWAHRADLAEAAITERHATRLWGLPGTNLAVVGWPASIQEHLFLRWHYWWQAHYLDCMIDAAHRRATPQRIKRIAATQRAIRLRNLSPLTANKYYDDKGWLALAFNRARHLTKLKKPANPQPLCRSIEDGIDQQVGAAPWRVGEAFFNVPTNGPAAMVCARTGKLERARELTDWVFSTLVNDEGLIMDGVRMHMDGPRVVPDVHPYCQGVMLGACLDIVNGLRTRAGVDPDARIDPATHPDVADAVADYSARICDLVAAIARHLATPSGVIDSATGGGDGGLFKGILARYLADVAISLPQDTATNRAARSAAASMVLASATSVWNHRLEVDGLPVCAADWTTEANLPRNTGVMAHSSAGAVIGSSVAERDLSVQLSGWMLLEAAARVSRAAENTWG